jgi:hypothetical protein
MYIRIYVHPKRFEVLAGFCFHQNLLSRSVNPYPPTLLETLSRTRFMASCQNIWRPSWNSSVVAIVRFPALSGVSHHAIVLIPAHDRMRLERPSRGSRTTVAVARGSATVSSQAPLEQRYQARDLRAPRFLGGTPVCTTLGYNSCKFIICFILERMFHETACAS